MNASLSSPRPWVAFDLDGTLTRRETLPFFLREALGTPRFLGVVARSLPELGAYGLGRMRNDAVKEIVLRRSLGGCALAGLRPVATHFAERILPHLLSGPVWARAQEHRARGHGLVLVTATLALYAEPWAAAAGFDAAIATELELDGEGRITGRLRGANCFGPEKARRLQEFLRGQPLLWAYGNSRGDAEMLDMAARPVWIGPPQHRGQKLPPLVSTD
ncbi:HAD-IB family hydrolase [Acidithiobacillus sp.]|uniref:HAD-IB family hydrolase n=1 Tax=Acidithiobacillus sp. TaxID=1872118 RepID=UPI0025BA9712|nr:HAD-IB family hydrolase [Acidithiobacillus sp.]